MLACQLSVLCPLWSPEIGTVGSHLVGLAVVGPLYGSHPGKGIGHGKSGVERLLNGHRGPGVWDGPRVCCSIR